MIRSALIAEISGAKVLSFHEDTSLHYLLLDSRKIISAPTSLFFAIRGVHHNSHQFIPLLYSKGVRHFVIEETTSLDISHYPTATFWLTNSSVDVLQKISQHHREQFSLPVLGITGSNGKTIVKEWLSQLLSQDFQLVKSPKSFNSQIGVPLSVWEINERHTLGIFEAGISLPEEMEKLEKIIQPTIGLITNIGPAHDEGFASSEQKINEKLCLFKHVSLLVYRKEKNTLTSSIDSLSNKKFCWSTTDSSADIFVSSIEKNKSNATLTILHNNTVFDLSIPMEEDASIENMMHCVTVLLYFGRTIEEIQQRIHKLLPVAMRLELKEGVNGCYLVDDTYNNDMAGLTMAVNFLEQQKQRTQKTVVLSDVLESGMEESILYGQIAALVKNKNIQRVIGIGPIISKNKHLFQNEQVDFYSSTEEFLASLSPKEFSNEVILIKGARKFAFEKIVRKLQQKMHGTILEVNLDALVHNLNFFRSRLRSDTKIMVMVKAFAYGSGSFEVANLLQYHRVDYLAVAYADEGVSLRENGISVPIMVMNPSYQTFDKLIHYRLEPELYSLKILNEFLTFLEDIDTTIPVHLKLDTGMRRLGFEEADLETLLSLIGNSSKLKIASIFTHLAAADDEVHNDFTRNQLSKFNKMADRIETAIGYTTLRHALNSAGIVRFPEAQMNMVRLGIGLYGVETNNLHQDSLQTVGTLKTILSQIKKVNVGESVGYSRKGVAERPTVIATIAIGYADGYDRGFSNGVGKVLVNGTLCPIIGNVCMDMCMVDITGVEAKEGDEVIVFGNTPTISEIAKAIGTIPYEILTGIGERVKRVFYTE